MEHFQWLDGQDLDEYIEKNKKEISHELADVFTYVLSMADELGIDLVEAVEEKIESNRKKYPVEKVNGHLKNYKDIKKDYKQDEI